MIRNITLPYEVLYIMSTLEAYEHKAYVVGGAVRDLLLGKEVHDFDMASSATPEEVKRIFSFHNLVHAGEEHGTIGIVLNNKVYELTTFRRDGNYRDHRRPDFVEFSTTLADDVKRRDFTINALAYHPVDGVIDYVGGLKDLSDGVLRTVGNPGKRFEEDALRIVRAFRFSATLGFPLTKCVRDAAFDAIHDLRYVAQERITSELKKLIVGDYVDLIWKDLRHLLFYLDFRFLVDSDGEKLKRLPPSVPIRLAFLYERSVDPESKVMKLLLSNKESSHILHLIHSIKTDPEVDKLSLLKMSRSCAVDLEEWLSLRSAFVNSNNRKQKQYQKIIHSIKEENIPMEPKELPINGKVLQTLGIRSGKSMGILLEEIWALVVKGELENTQEAISTYVLSKTN